MDRLPAWLHVAVAAFAGLAGGVVGAITFIVNLNSRFYQIELKIAGMEAHLEKRLKETRHEIYTSMTTNVIGPIQLDMDAHEGRVRTDIKALADRMVTLGEQVAILIDRSGRVNPLGKP